jgi:hypothetical protein
MNLDTFNNLLNKQQFSQIKSIEGQLNFWETTLNCNYARQFELDQLEINDFVIKTQKSEEIEDINEYCLDQIKAAPSLLSEQKMVSYDELEKIFEDKYCTTLKPEEFLNQEIDRIHTEVQSLMTGVTDMTLMVMNDPVNDIRFFSDLDQSEQRDAFKLGFVSGFRDQSFPDLSQEIYDTRLLVIMHNGFTYAQYSLFLQEQDSRTDNLSANHATGLKTQLAILELLGVKGKLTKVGTNLNASKLLSILLNRSEEAIRRELSKSFLLEDEFKTRNKPKQEIWREIDKLFRSLDFKDITNKITELRKKYQN